MSVQHIACLQMRYYLSCHQAVLRVNALLHSHAVNTALPGSCISQRLCLCLSADGTEACHADSAVQHLLPGACCCGAGVHGVGPYHCLDSPPGPSCT